MFGQDPLWLAWANDLINFKKAGDMAAYNNLLATVTPARFKVSQMIGATGLLLGIALAMFRRVDADKRVNYKSMFISTALAVFLTGVTEPLEFMFMFCAMPLYIVYALLQGCAFAMAGCPGCSGQKAHRPDLVLQGGGRQEQPGGVWRSAGAAGV